MVFVQDNFFRHCAATPDGAGGVPYEGYCDTGDPGYESWTEDPETEWSAFQIVDGDTVVALPQWADSLVDPPGTGSAYTDGSLSHYYHQMSGGQMRLEGYIYPELIYLDTEFSSPPLLQGLTRAVVAHINANPHGLDFSQFDRYINGTGNYGPDTDGDGEPDGDGVFDMLIINHRAKGSFLGLGTRPSYAFADNPNHDHFDPDPLYLGGLRVKDNPRYGSGFFAAGGTRRGMVSLVGHEMGHAQIGCHNFDARLHIMSYSRPSASMSAPERMMLGWVTPRIIDMRGVSRQQESLLPSIYSYEALRLTNGPPGYGDVIVEARTFSSAWDGPIAESDDDWIDQLVIPNEGLYFYKQDSDGNASNGLENFGGRGRHTDVRYEDRMGFGEGDVFSPFSAFGSHFHQNPYLDRHVGITDITRSGETFTFNLWGDYLREDAYGQKSLLLNYSFDGSQPIIPDDSDDSKALARQYDWHLGGDLRFEAGMAVDSANSFTLDPGTRLRLGRTRQEAGNGNVSVVGVPGDSVRFEPAIRGQRWHGIEVEADDALFNYVAAEGADVGLEVRSRGAVIQNARFADGGVGVQAEYAFYCYPSNPPFPGDCISDRSDFELISSRVEGNTGVGVFARNADFVMEETVVRGNGQHGVVLWNAVGEDFFSNEVVENGAADGGLYHGIGLTENSDLELSGISLFGLNKVANNARHEIGIVGGSFAFIGAGRLSGHNAIYDDAPSAGSRLVYYAPGTSGGTSPPVLRAEYTFWGSPSGPPAGSIKGNVDAEPFLATDPTGTGSRTAEPPESAEGAWPGTERRLADDEIVWLRDQIESTREALAADLGAEGAADLVTTLYQFQRLDRDDVMGEYAATMALLGALRVLLDGGDPLPVPLAATAERSLQSEVAEALLRERYDEATALLGAYGTDAADDEAQRGLALSEVMLDEQAARYDEALAGIEAVIASLGEDETDLATDLALIAAAITEAGGLETAGRDAPAGETAAALAARSESLPQRFGLGAPYPNPARGTVVVPLALPAAAEARVALYDVLGRRVALLAERRFEAGHHTLALRTADLAGGLYLVRAVFTGHGGAVQSFARRLTVLR